MREGTSRTNNLKAPPSLQMSACKDPLDGPIGRVLHGYEEPYPPYICKHRQVVCLHYIGIYLLKTQHGVHNFLR